MSETRKRGRQWRHVKQKSVEPGVSGLLFTCSGSEKHAVREAYNLITTLFEQQPSTAGHSDVSQSMHNDRDGACGDASESASDCDDVADVIKRFCSQARESRTMADHKRRLRQRPTGVNNCIFLAFDDELAGSIYSFADRIVSMALEGPCCRLLQRVIPVEVTCQVDMSAVSREVYRLVAKHFVADSDGKWPTYSVEFKARNNSSVKRSVALNMVCETVAQIAPLCRACLQQPDIAVLFQVLHKTFWRTAGKGD
ncbi:THUMP domain-containing protein 1 [Toxocara canis]|uniref:THUMP domain-containing protein 1 n=1 Tax=Toxocara canis TaxID=6265 RepID=A0A0B2V1H5_TOXCA|nr:THUMP domain-containing protein 1 [Toxocara canis]